jgi:hypothetical protein
MATEIIQLPNGSNGNGGGMNVLPVGNNGNGLFGNGSTSLVDLFGFAIIASMFPGIFGGVNNNRGGNCGCDGALALQAITAEGAQSRAAVEALAASMGQSYSTILPAVQSVQTTLAGLASQNGMGFLQVINALQQGNSNLASQLSQCCCENRLLTTTQGFESQLATERQTTSLNTNITAQGQRQVDAIADLKTTMIKEFCDARERDMQAIIDKQADEISQLRTKDNINAQTAQILSYVDGKLAPIAAGLKELQDKAPNTVPVTWPNLSVVNNTPQTGGYYYPGYQ